MKTLDQKDQRSSVNLGQLPPALAIADHAWQGKHRPTEERKSGAVHSHINLLNLETFNSVVALTNPNFESKYLAKFEAQLTEEFAQLDLPPRNRAI